MAGKVYLAGAGPGAPELLTTKVKKALERADVILHDALVGPKLQESLSKLSSGEVIDCGKRKGQHKFSQEEINQLLVKRAKDGDIVVRLKGGDPFIFGRGGEELQILKKHGIKTEIIPGITSAIAAPEVAGIPLTHRKVASHVTFVTGHESPAKDSSSIDWEKLAKLDGTLVVLMGITKLKEISQTLIEYGRDPSIPAATIEKGTLADQKGVKGKLKNIAKKVRQAGIKPPGTTIIGDVVEVSEDY